MPTLTHGSCSMSTGGSFGAGARSWRAVIDEEHPHFLSKTLANLANCSRPFIDTDPMFGEREVTTGS